MRAWRRAGPLRHTTVRTGEISGAAAGGLRRRHSRRLAARGRRWGLLAALALAGAGIAGAGVSGCADAAATGDGDSASGGDGQVHSADGGGEGGDGRGAAGHDGAIQDGAIQDGAVQDGVGQDGAGADASTQRACNGHPKLCGRRLDQVVFPATHNSMSNSDEGWAFANQNKGLATQLNDGVRGFLIDTHKWSNPDDPSTTSWLCHGPCVLGSIRLVDALGVFADFLAKHPNEVLIFVVEDALPAADFAQEMKASGLLPYVITHKVGTPFPTLDALIDANTRLLVTVQGKGGTPAWMLGFNSVGFDTPYAFKTMAALQKSGGDDDSCRRFRGTEGAPLFLVNHWVAEVLPTPFWSEQANAADVLLTRAQRCAALHKRPPTLLAVDHYDLGGLFSVVRTLNGLP